MVQYGADPSAVVKPTGRAVKVQPRTGGKPRGIEELEAELGVRDLTEVIEPLNVFLYGDTGAGKTVLSASIVEIPEMRPILFINIEGGTRSIKSREGIRVVDLRTPLQARLVRQYLKDNWKKFRCVIMDSLTEYRILESRGVLAQAMLTDATHDKEVLNLRDWGKTHDRVREFVRFLRDLPIYTIVTALMSKTKDETTGALHIEPMLSEKLNGTVPGYFDLVGYLQVENVGGKKTRRLYVQPTDKMKAKDRTDALGEYIDNPTMEKLLSKTQPRGYFSPGVFDEPTGAPVEGQAEVEAQVGEPAAVSSDEKKEEE